MKSILILSLFWFCLSDPHLHNEMIPSSEVHNSGDRINNGTTPYSKYLNVNLDITSEFDINTGGVRILTLDSNPIEDGCDWDTEKIYYDQCLVTYHTFIEAKDRLEQISVEMFIFYCNPQAEVNSSHILKLVCRSTSDNEVIYFREVVYRIISSGV